MSQHSFYRVGKSPQPSHNKSCVKSKGKSPRVRAFVSKSTRQVFFNFGMNTAVAIPDGSHSIVLQQKQLNMKERSADEIPVWLPRAEARRIILLARSAEKLNKKAQAIFMEVHFALDLKESNFQ